MSLGSIVVRLSMQTADFETDAGRASKTAERRAKEIDSAFSKAGVAIGAALGTAAVAVGVAVKGAIDHADKLNDMNQRLGVSAEALSGYGYAAQQTGTDLDDLGLGLKKLASNMADALDPKSPQAGFFKALGISVTDAAGRLRAVDDVLPEIASKFKELDNASLESSLAVDLFGKSGDRMLEFLNQGDDGLARLRDRARELGVEISGPTMQAADEFNDTLGDIKTITQGLALRLAADLLPSLQDTADMMRDGAQQGGEFGGIFDFIRGQAEAAVKDLQFFLKTGQELVQFFDDAFKPRGGPALERWKQLHQFDNVKGGVQTLQRQGRFSAEYEKASLNFNPGTADLESRLTRAYGGSPSKSRSGGGSKKAEISEEEKALKRLNEEYDRELASMKERLGLLGLETEASRTQWDVDNGRFRDLEPMQKAALVAEAALFDAKQKAIEQSDAEKRAREDAQRGYDDAIRAIREEGETLGMTNDQLEIYNRLKAAGSGLTDAMRDSIIAETEMLQGQRNAMDDQITMMDAARDSVRGFFSDVTKGANAWDAAKEALGRFADALTDLVAQRAMEQLFGQMGSSGSGTSGGNWLGNLFGSVFSSWGGSGGSSGGSGGGLGWMANGYSDGGWTGPGGVKQPRGIVHADEIVWSKGDVARAGGVAAVEAMRHGNTRSAGNNISVSIGIRGDVTPRTANQLAGLTSEKLQRAGRNR